MSHACCWVIKPNENIDGKFSKAIYCNKPVKYKMVLDEDSGTKVRKYDSFCQEHMEKSKEQENQDPDWDFV